MYPWLVFVHVLGVFGFLLSHGASAAASFVLRRERNPERVHALLELSTSSYGVMYGSLLLLLITGVITGFMGRWWGHGWIWVALGLLIAISVVMSVLGASYYGTARKAAGLPYFEGGKSHPPLEPQSPEVVDVLLAKANPVLLTVIGFGGIAVIAWLMMFKPF